jgi:hypothetical protein
MSKIINVYQNSGQNLEGAYNIHVDKINELANYSLSNIFLPSLNYLAEEKAVGVLQELINKLALSGKIAIKILDLKPLCLDYINNALEDKLLFSLIENIKNLISFDTINQIISKDSDTTISKIDKDKYFNIITIERINL